MDKEQAFKFLCNVAEGIALMFGKNCETLVHDLSDKGLKVLAIYNGHVSGREVGSELDIYGNRNQLTGPNGGNSLLELLKNKSFVNNLVITKNGKKIKSSTFPFISDNFSYALGINLDITTLDDALSYLQDFLRVEGDLVDKIYTTYYENQLEELFAKAVVSMGLNKPINKLNKGERLQLVSILKEKNMFHIQKSVPFVAEKLGVSRYTIYNYLKELEK